MGGSFNRSSHHSVHYTIEHVRDTDSNKSSDFLMNPVCMMLIYINYVLLRKYLCLVQMK